MSVFLEAKSIGPLVDAALSWILLIAKRSQFERANAGCFEGRADRDNLGAALCVLRR